VVADEVVNAAGAWAGVVADLAGIRIPMVYSKGSLLVTQHRLAHHAINRLRPAGDGDILMPGGTVSILGTTSVRTGTPDHPRPGIPEVNHIIEQGAAMIPALETTRFIRAYSGVRPLISCASRDDDRGVSRGYALMDHGSDGVANFTTITGGKLTTFRLMAEKTADHVCRHLGISAPCRTREDRLPPSDSGRWTEPGLSPRAWIQQKDPDDLILCECELVSARAVESIISTLAAQGGAPALKAIGRRSRIGKGPCQGAYCSIRLITHLYDRGYFTGRTGIDDLKRFLSERWRGEHPILWGMPLAQAELQEAFQCGLLGLER
jgi:glycerol-3-phosphate dehydrogenase